MSEVLYFSRDTKLLIEIGSEVWEIPVLNGFSFAQATNTTEIGLNEMATAAGLSRRARRVFNDSYAPAEWSFSTYVRPFVSAGTGAGAADDDPNHHAVEEALWALTVGRARYDDATFSFDGVTPGVAGLDIDFDDSNRVTLGEANIYFVLNGCEGVNTKTYRINKSVVNEVTLNFDIQGIASIDWSGFGSEIEEVVSAPTRTIYEAIDSTDNFIRNRLTSLAISGTPGQGFKSNYNLTLTGGSITINNNITFLTPEELCKVNLPIGHVTGTRTIGGNFTSYLVLDTTTPTPLNTTGTLYKDLVEATQVVTNSFGLVFSVGGTINTPRVEFNIPKAHLEIPVHSIEDIISVDATFHALPSSLSDTDEMTIKYVGAA